MGGLTDGQTAEAQLYSYTVFTLWALHPKNGQHLIGTYYVYHVLPE